MAEIRNPVSTSNPSSQRVTPVRSEAARAAQRAFFEAALSGVAPTSSNTAKFAPSTPIQTVRPDAASPNRILRPGSLVDIKV